MTNSVSSFTINIQNLEKLEAFAGRLASLLQPGDVIAFNGTLGAGKTTLIQMLTKAMGVTEKVISPTFVLVHEYLSGKYPIIHADLYRLGPEKSDSLADEIFAFSQQGIVLVEWAEYGDFLTDLTTLTIDIKVNPQTEVRELQIKSTRKDFHEQLG